MNPLALLIEKLLELAGIATLETGFEIVVKNRRNMALAVKTSLFGRKHRIRVSFAELLSLEEGDSYLLIRNIRRPERFGPIGGVVRVSPRAMQTLVETIEYEPEFKAGPEMLDLRGYIRGSKFISLLKWYYTGFARETNALAREIQEELGEIGLKSLGRSSSLLEFRLRRVVHEGPYSMKGVNFKQYRLFHVYELDPEHKQSLSLRKRLIKHAATNPNLLLANPEEILRGRSLRGELIGDHSGYLVGDSKGGGGPPPPFWTK